MATGGQGSERRGARCICCHRQLLAAQPWHLTACSNAGTPQGPKSPLSSAWPRGTAPKGGPEAEFLRRESHHAAPVTHGLCPRVGQKLQMVGAAFVLLSQASVARLGTTSLKDPPLRSLCKVASRSCTWQEDGEEPCVHTRVLRMYPPNSSSSYSPHNTFSS